MSKIFVKPNYPVLSNLCLEQLNLKNLGVPTLCSLTSYYNFEHALIGSCLLYQAVSSTCVKTGYNRELRAGIPSSVGLEICRYDS